MTKILTKQLIIQKAKTNVMENIKSINLWGNDLEEISFITQLINLELAQLASNKINTLKDVVKCLHLKDLNLRNNIISNIEELQLLKQLQNLKALNLLYNPVTQHPNYRQQVLKYAPQLEKLDDTVISQQERQQIQQEEEKENQIKQNVSLDYQQIQKIDSKISKKRFQDKKGRFKKIENFRQELNNNQENNKSQKGIKQSFYDQTQELQDSYIYNQQDIQFSNQNKNMSMLVEEKTHSQFQINDKIQEEGIPFPLQKSEQITNIQQPTQNSKKNTNFNGKPDSFETSQHILCAILSLLEELKQKDIEILKNEVERKLQRDIS